MYQAFYSPGSMQDHSPSKKGLGYPVNAPEWWPKPLPTETTTDVGEGSRKGDFGESYEKWLHSRTEETAISSPVEEYTPGQLIIMHDITRMLIMNIHAPSEEVFHQMSPGQQKACVEEFIGVKAAFFFGSRMHKAGKIHITDINEQQKKYSGRLYFIPEPSEIVLDDVAALARNVRRIPAATTFKINEAKEDVIEYDDATSLAKSQTELKLQNEAGHSLVDGGDELPLAVKNNAAPAPDSPHVPLSIALLFQDMTNSCGGRPLMDVILEHDFKAFIIAHKDSTWGETPLKKRLMVIQGITDQLKNLKRKNREMGKKYERESDPRKLAAALDVQLAKIVEEMTRQKKNNLNWPSSIIAAITKAPKERKGEVVDDGGLKRAKKEQQQQQQEDLNEGGTKELKELNNDLKEKMFKVDAERLGGNIKG